MPMHAPLTLTRFQSTLTLPLVIAGALAFAASADAQQRALKVNLEPGTQLGFNEDVDMQMDLKMDINGQKLDMAGTIATDFMGSVKVLESANGTPTRVELTFAPGTNMAMDMGGMKQNQPFELAGQTVTVTLGPGGTVQTIDPAPTDPTVEEQVQNILKFGKGVLPPNPVGPGDTWQPTDPNLFGGGMQTGEQTTLTLVGFEQKTGREAARITINGDLAGEMQGMNSTGNIQGTYFVDAATGVVLDSDLSGNLTVQAENPQGAQGSVNGTMAVTAKVGKVINAGGAGAVGAAGAASATPPTAAATPTPPSAAGVDVAPFVGTYSDADVTVEVTADGAVNVVRGGQTYPGRAASATANGFSGSFTAGGSSFPFNATTTAGGLSFTSGSKTYQLTREGGAGTDDNPLGM